MAQALIKVIYRAEIGTSPNLVTFEFGNKVKLRGFLQEYVSKAGSGVAIALKKATYKWNDSTSQFDITTENVVADDLI